MKELQFTNSTQTKAFPHGGRVRYRNNRQAVAERSFTALQDARNEQQTQKERIKNYGHQEEVRP